MIGGLDLPLHVRPLVINWLKFHTKVMRWLPSQLHWLNKDSTRLLHVELTLMGVYHLVWFWWWVGADFEVGRFIIGSSGSSSGRDTIAFLAFSSLAPSSVEPFSPQRTWTSKTKHSTNFRDKNSSFCSFLNSLLIKYPNHISAATINWAIDQGASLRIT